MAKLQNHTAVDSKVLLSKNRDFFPFVCKRRLRTVIGTFTFGVLSCLITPTPGLGAEKISFDYPPFGEFSISRHSLEVFAKKGQITPEFAFYAKRIKPKQLAQLRELLQTRFEVTPTLVSQFTYSKLGEKLLQRFGELLRTQKRHNGFYALRSALILAAADPEGLTVVNAIRHYSSGRIQLNLSETQDIIDNLSDLLKKRDATVVALQQTAAKEADTQPKIDFSQKPDLRLAGLFKWHKQPLTLNDRSRKRRFGADLYIPQATKSQQPLSPFPVIVISHGVAEDRTTFTYLAEHLASYGFAVALLEHPDSDSKRFQQYFSGLAGPPEAKELIDQPLDVKFLLDELQGISESDPNLKGQLNIQQVGAIGHSLGGYNVLASSGAKINFTQIYKDCNPNRSLDLSVFLQCRASELPPRSYPIQDRRIKAVMAINPLDSTILGQRGLSQIKVPVMLVAGSQDIFTPAVPEQIRPFTWLQTSNKYLMLIENGTHFSTLGHLNPANSALPVPSSLIGTDLPTARSYINALGLAFFQTYLTNRQEYRPYLSASYATFISQPPLNLSLVQSFTAEQLAQIYNDKSLRSLTPPQEQRRQKTLEYELSTPK